MIYLVRHGEAAAGWGDHPDPGLSDLGHKQAEAVGRALLGLGANHLICSPMQRCRETASPLAAMLDRPAHIVPAISEIITPPGISDRVTWLRDLMAGTWPPNMDEWCRAAYDAVVALPDGTAVFSHFVAINAIAGQITGRKDVLIFKPGHCSVTVLEQTPAGKLQVKSWGEEAATRVL